MKLEMRRAIVTAWVVIVTTGIPAALSHGVVNYPYNDRNYTACLFLSEQGYNLVAFQVKIITPISSIQQQLTRSSGLKIPQHGIQRSESKNFCFHGEPQLFFVVILGEVFVRTCVTFTQNFVQFYGHQLFLLVSCPLILCTFTSFYTHNILKPVLSHQFWTCGSICKLLMINSKVIYLVVFDEFYRVTSNIRWQQYSIFNTHSLQLSINVMILIQILIRRIREGRDFAQLVQKKFPLSLKIDKVDFNCESTIIRSPVFFLHDSWDVWNQMISQFFITQFSEYSFQNVNSNMD